MPNTISAGATLFTVDARQGGRQRPGRRTTTAGSRVRCPFTALEKSKHPGCPCGHAIGPEVCAEFYALSGFLPLRHSPTLSTALGSGTVTICVMRGLASIRVNGGYRVRPYLIDKIVDESGRVIATQANRESGDGDNPRDSGLQCLCDVDTLNDRTALRHRGPRVPLWPPGYRREDRYVK